MYQISQSAVRQTPTPLFVCPTRSNQHTLVQQIVHEVYHAVSEAESLRLIGRDEMTTRDYNLERRG